MEPTNPTPEQLARVAQAIYVGLGFGALLVTYFVLSTRVNDADDTRWSLLVAWVRFALMSRAADAGAEDSSAKVVFRPVDATSMDAQTGHAAAGGMDEAAPDIDAANWPRYLSDDELIVFLAAQKLRNGKYRSSANKIVAFLGGDRNHILKLVREVRDGVPVYRQYTAEERAVLQPKGNNR
jgi:hypothetical protein